MHDALDWDGRTRSLGASLLIRKIVEAAFVRRAYGRVRRIQTKPAARAQAHTLLRLLRRGRATAFGRAHDFARIRTPEDYRRLVPVRTPGEFEKDLSAEPGGLLHRQPRANLTLGALHIQGLETAVSLFAASHRRAAVAPGTWLVGGDYCEALFSAAKRTRSFYRTLVPWPAGDFDPADGVSGPSVTVLFASTEQLQATLPRFLEASSNSGCAGSAAIPRVAFRLLTPHGRGECSPVELESALRAPANRISMTIMDMLVLPEAPIAVTDPRFARLRLLADLDAYFEFVPEDQVGRLRPERVDLSGVRPGRTYAVAVTSPAGAWSCLTELRVSFDQVEPPILRTISPAVTAEQPLRKPTATPSTPVRTWGEVGTGSWAELPTLGRFL